MSGSQSMRRDAVFCLPDLVSYCKDVGESPFGIVWKSYPYWFSASSMKLIAPCG